MLQAVGLVARFDDVAVVRKPIQQGGGHLGVAEHARPFCEAQVGRDHDAGVLVQLGQQVKKQSTASLTEWQVTQLIEDDQVHAQQCLGDAPGFTVMLLALQQIDQVNRGVEAHALAVQSDAGHG